MGNPQGAPFAFTRTVTIRFPVINVSTEVQHLCGEIPSGVLAINGGVVKPVAGVQWTKQLAYLQSDTVGPAVLVFVVLQEEPIDVNP